MASVYARCMAAHGHSKAVCAVNLYTEVEPVYNIYTTALHTCCSQSCAPKCSHNGLLAKCCGGQGASLMETETVD